MLSFTSQLRQQSWTQPNLAWLGPTCRIKGLAKARPGPMDATPLRQIFMLLNC